MQSKPAKRQWIDLSTRGGEWGREDCQDGWHYFVNSMNLGSILDVGAGLGLSKIRIKLCTTQDIAPLEQVDLTGYPLSRIPDRSYTAVTAFDVIEHVLEDIDFLIELCRISTQYVFITTPNFNASKAMNGCHCREYTPSEFLALLARVALNWKLKLYCGDGRGLNPKCIGLDKFDSHLEPHQAVLLERSPS